MKKLNTHRIALASHTTTAVCREWKNLKMLKKSPTTIRIKIQSLLRLKTVNVAKTHKLPTIIEKIDLRYFSAPTMIKI